MRPLEPAARTALFDSQHMASTLDRASLDLGPFLVSLRLCVLTCRARLSCHPHSHNVASSS